MSQHRIDQLAPPWLLSSTNSLGLNPSTIPRAENRSQAFGELNNSRKPRDILDILHLVELFIAGKLQGCEGNSTDLKRS